MDPVASWSRRVTVAASILTGLAILGYYTVFLYREELRDWQEYGVLFDDVGGLRAKDEVRVGGARMGRVKSVELFEDRRLVRLQLLPDVRLHEGAQVSIVAANSLGYVLIEVDPGRPDAPVLEPGSRLEGRLSPGLAQGATVPGRRRLLAESIREFADATEEVKNPASGRVGQLLFDHERTISLRQGLKQVQDLWAGIDEGLAQAESRQGFGAGLDPAALDAVGNTVRGLRTTFGSVARGLREAQRGEGQAGRMLADPAETGPWRDGILTAAESVRDVRAGRGPLGRLSDPASGLAESLDGTISSLAAVTSDAVAGRGILGLLASPRYDEPTRNALTRAPRALDELNRSSLVRDPDARRKLADALATAEDRIIALRRGAAALRANQSTRTFPGAIFSVF